MLGSYTHCPPSVGSVSPHQYFHRFKSGSLPHGAQLSPLPPAVGFPAPGILAAPDRELCTQSSGGYGAPSGELGASSHQPSWEWRAQAAARLEVGSQDLWDHVLQQE